MKKLKTFPMGIALLLCCLPLLHSCLNDWDDADYSSLAIGTLRIVEGREYYFALDEGTKMYPGDTTAVRNYPLVDGQRAFISFNLLDEQVTGYDYNARINHIENILTKDVYRMPAEKADSIGDDRININSLWITDNYLNIQYQFFYGNQPEKKHMLNLVVNEASDGTHDQEGYLTLEFRHNAYDDNQSLQSTPGVVSFKMNGITDLLGDKKGLNIHYRSLYDGERYQTIDFKK